VERSGSVAILAPGERDARAPIGSAPQEKLKNLNFNFNQVILENERYDGCCKLFNFLAWQASLTKSTVLEIMSHLSE